jgi:hypothetical protein
MPGLNIDDVGYLLPIAVYIFFYLRFSSPFVRAVLETVQLEHPTLTFLCLGLAFS